MVKLLHMRIIKKQNRTQIEYFLQNLYLLANAGHVVKNRIIRLSKICVNMIFTKTFNLNSAYSTQT